MFAYYLELAFRSLRRSPGLMALMVLAIGFGVSACMTTWSVFRAASGDPIPWKSSQLFVPQIDLWSSSARSADGEPLDALTYTDALALMRDHRAVRQSAIYGIAPAVFPARPRWTPVPEPHRRDGPDRAAVRLLPAGDRAGKSRSRPRRS